jgi:ribonuclease T2
MSKPNPRLTAALLCLAALAFATPARTQSPAPAGRFDYYLLALSWSPAYCAKHGADAASSEECSRHRGFVVHGLWPQNQDGTWPAFCRPVSTVPVPLLEREAAIMPNVELIAHEWAKHGSCTTLDVRDYFAEIEQAFAALRLPDTLVQPPAAVNIPLAEAKQHMSALNPGLAPDMMSFQCGHGNEVSELHICLDKSLQFRACGAGQADTCAASLRFDPVGTAAR